MRDECTATYGPEHPRCAPLIEAHKQCLRAEGFNVRGVGGAGGVRVLAALEEWRVEAAAVAACLWA